MNRSVDENWVDSCLESLQKGRAGSVCMDSLLNHGAFMVFQNDSGVLRLLYRRGYSDPDFRYHFLERNPELLYPVLSEGWVQVPNADVSESGRQVHVFVDEKKNPGYLAILESSDFSLDKEGSLLRAALVLSLVSENKKTSPYRGEQGLQAPVARLIPVWLEDDYREILAVDDPVLFVSESGSGAEELVRSLIRGRFGMDEKAVFFYPGRLSSAVQLREIFGDPAGARLGGSGAGIPFVERDAGAIVVQEPANLEYRVQERLAEFLSGHPEGQVWYFLSTLDLESLRDAGKFHPDLFEVLKRNQYILPPLRARKDRILEESDRLLRMFRDQFRRRVELSEAAREALQSYNWPGNWRELKATLESAFLMNGSGFVSPEELRMGSWESPDSFGDELNLRKRSAELEKDLLLQAYAIHGGNQVHMARALGISRGSLQYKLEKYGIS